VITPTTPLGEALQDLRLGDVAVVETGPQIREYEIVNVW
jgi:transcription elongation GreA/GreB family factor